MADRSEATEGELIISIKEALKREKSKFQRRISNAHKLKDLDSTFQELNKLPEAVVKGTFGGLRERPKYSITELYPSYAAKKLGPNKDCNVSPSKLKDEQSTSVDGLLRPCYATRGLQSHA